MGLIEVIGVPDSAPGPEADAEQALRVMLKDFDSLLDIRWMPIAFYNAVKSRWEGRYALTCDWPTIDPRWAMVQSGEMDPKLAHDIVGWLCEEMSDSQSMPTTLAGMGERVMALLGTMDNTRYPWKQRMMATVEKNRKRHDTNKAEVADLTHDVASYYYNQAKGNPIVPVSINLKKRKTQK